MSVFFTRYRPVIKKSTWFVTQILIITKKSSTYTKGEYSSLSYDINIYIPGSNRFEKKLLMSVFFTIYRPVSKKRTWFVTQIQIITKKKARHTLKGTIVVFYSYDINIYTPAFRHFEKKLLMSGFLERNSSCWAKEERDLSRKYTLLLKKTRHALKETIVVFRTALIFISQNATVLRKNCLCKHFFTKYPPVGKKRTWFVTQIQIITKKRSTYTQGDYSGLSYDINIYMLECRRFEKKLLM